MAPAKVNLARMFWYYAINAKDEYNGAAKWGLTYVARV
jgi:hypothetical protein